MFLISHDDRTTSRSPTPSSRSTATLFAIVLAFAMVACQPEAAEVEDAALTDDTISEEVTEGETTDAAVSVAEAGPAAWTCERYLRVSDETSQHYDLEATETAEAYVDQYWSAAENDATHPRMRPDVPIRAAVQDACEESPDEVLTTVAETLLVDPDAIDA